MKRTHSLYAALIVLGLVACGGDRGGDALASDVEEGELRETSRGEAELSSNDGLKIRLEMVDGAKPRTKNKRFIRGRFTRDRKTVTLWCRGVARAEKDVAVKTRVRCVQGASTVSNDDDESIEIAIVRQGDKATAEIDYAGDGTFLGDVFSVLAGSASQDQTTVKLDLSVTSNPDNIDKNPFSLLDRVASAVSAMIGKTVHVQDEDVDARLKVRVLSALVDDKMTMSFVTKFARDGVDGPEAEDVSLLQTKGELASGIASEATMKDRIRTSLELE